MHFQALIASLHVRAGRAFTHAHIHAHTRTCMCTRGGSYGVAPPPGLVFTKPFVGDQTIPSPMGMPEYTYRTILKLNEY